MFRFIIVAIIAAYPVIFRWHIGERIAMKYPVDDPRLRGLYFPENERDKVNELIKFCLTIPKEKNFFVFPIPTFIYFVCDRKNPVYQTVYDKGFEFRQIPDEFRMINEIERKRIDYVIVPKLKNDGIYEGMPNGNDDLKSSEIGQSQHSHHNILKMYLLQNYIERKGILKNYWLLERND